jgi:hypothetical protein
LYKIPLKPAPAKSGEVFEYTIFVETETYSVLNLLLIYRPVENEAEN